eukprot:12924339-Prorocentrum_lima.AAC.1
MIIQENDNIVIQNALNVRGIDLKAWMITKSLQDLLLMRLEVKKRGTHDDVKMKILVNNVVEFKALVEVGQRIEVAK